MKFYLNNLLIVFLSLSLTYAACFGQHISSSTYIPPADTLVQKKLEHWQDLKFGLMMHWGPYSQWGIVESWSLCNEDLPFTQRTKGNFYDYSLYKKDYENLKTTFMPYSFDPVKLAKAAKDAGMKYVVFTTKHHDGFSMFDTQYSDYKITSKECPFHTHPNADITKAIFHNFRTNDFMVGAYYSKPDWHNENYWWPYFATPDRHVNYDPLKYPQRWENFKNFSHNQVKELMSRYGSIDILWLDGGWVNPTSKNQDINIPALAKMARMHQPSLLIVDRSVSGAYENYLTPEQTVPDQLITVPWESCITMGDSWSYLPNDKYKSAKELIHLLIDIVSKGGNLLLNIGVSPEGDFPEEAYERLKQIGRWMIINEEAIYKSRPISPFNSGRISFTQSSNSNSIYAIYRAEADEQYLPARMIINNLSLPYDFNVRLLGNSEILKFEKTSNGISILIPRQLRNNPPCAYAWTFKISKN